MSAIAPHDAIALEALPAVEALESGRGNRLDFEQADAELRRLECRWDSRNTANIAAIVAITVLLGTLERPYDYVAGAAVFIALAVFAHVWKRTARARAIKRVKQAVHDWLAFGAPDA